MKELIRLQKLVGDWDLSYRRKITRLLYDFFPDGVDYETIAVICAVDSSNIRPRLSEMEDIGVIRKSKSIMFESGRFRIMWKLTGQGKREGKQLSSGIIPPHGRSQIMSQFIGKTKF